MLECTQYSCQRSSPLEVQDRGPVGRSLNGQHLDPEVHSSTGFSESNTTQNLCTYKCYSQIMADSVDDDDASLPRSGVQILKTTGSFASSASEDDADGGGSSSRSVSSFAASDDDGLGTELSGLQLVGEAQRRLPTYRRRISMTSSYPTAMTTMTASSPKLHPGRWSLAPFRTAASLAAAMTTRRILIGWWMRTLLTLIPRFALAPDEALAAVAAAAVVTVPLPSCDPLPLTVAPEQ